MSDMATNDGEVDEGVQEASTVNESIEIEQEACQGESREHQGADQVQNQKGGGGLFSWSVKKYHQWRGHPVSPFSYIGPSTIRTMSVMTGNAEESLQELAAGEGILESATNAIMTIGSLVVAASGADPVLQFAAVPFVITREFMKWWNWSNTIAQCKLIEGVPQEGDLAYQQHVSRCLHRPYTFKFSHPTDTITGIACVPVNEKTQSPEAEVIEGGINYNHVTICLTPVAKGKWECKVAICTKPSPPIPAIELDSTCAAAPPGETTSAAAPPGETTSAAAPPGETTSAAAPSPAVPAGTLSALKQHWLVALMVVMGLMFVMIMMMVMFTFLFILRS